MSILANPQTAERARLKHALMARFRPRDFLVDTHYMISTDAIALHVTHVASAITAQQMIIPDYEYAAAQHAIAELEHCMYSALSRNGHADCPLSENDGRHEHLRALLMLADQKLFRHDLPGDRSLMHLVDQKTRAVHGMSSECLTLPLDYWQQLLVDIVAKRSCQQRTP